ncbi:MAG: tyrosine-type recombinase/integrase [Candidatus Lokiarchaeota archaeon]|nr:tyrosine-type recombinase/integrase [Candidatus Lokiarchaeota archaeon]
MADYKFYLKEKNADKETQIRLHIHYNNKISKVYIGEKINPCFWNSSNMRAKQTKKFPEHPEFNDRLDNAITNAKIAMDALRKENNGQYPDPRSLSRRVRIVMGLEKGSERLSLFQYFDKRIKEEEIRLAAIGRKIHSGSFPRGLQRTKELLMEFEKDKGTKLSFDTVDLGFYHDLLDYMQNTKGYKYNTMGKHVKLIKHVMKTASADGMHNNMSFTHPKFKILEQEVKTIYLDEDDLQLLENLNLEKNPGLDRARDLFLAGCWTGVRFSDWSKISQANIQERKLIIDTQKTGKKVLIPVLPQLERILEKYSEEELPSITNQSMNRSLKELGKMMIKNSKLKSIGGGASKYLRISTHTARRSFATNLYRRGIPIESIMYVTGHKTQREFYKYIRIPDEEHADSIRQFFPQSSVQLKSTS